MAVLTVLALVVTGSALGKSQAAKPADPWTRVTFLVGEWQGLGTGAPGEGEGGTTFAFNLDKKILVRKNWAKYPPRSGEKAGVSHEDLMIIYPSGDRAKLLAIYFDNEGHVIQYSLSFGPKDGSVVFETNPAQPGPRFRLTYDLRTDGVLDNVFWIAPPGGDFKAYVRGSLKRK
jgi:hypothetical protein